MKMALRNTIATFALILVAASNAEAQFNFNSLTQDDLDGANKEFSHNFLFTSVSGASSLGRLWGFEVGLTGGTSDADKISEIIKRTSPSSDFKDLYSVGLLGRISIPFGVTLEAGLLPKTKVQDAEISQVAAALRYTIIELPVAVGLRAHYSKTDFSFAQTSGAFVGNIDYDSNVYGVQALVSQNFVMIEPYAGIGWAHGKGDLNASGSGSIGSFGNAGSSKESSVQFMGGVNLHLGFLNLGAEYSRAFETNRISGKLAIGF